MDKELQEQIAQLQMLEQTIQQVILQKQTMQIQIGEMANALEELGKTNEKPFKVVGNVMVACEKNDLKKDIKDKKEMFEIRIKNIEKQEKDLKEKMDDLQKKLMERMQK